MCFLQESQAWHRQTYKPTHKLCQPWHENLKIFIRIKILQSTWHSLAFKYDITALSGMFNTTVYETSKRVTKQCLKSTWTMCHAKKQTAGGSSESATLSSLAKDSRWWQRIQSQCSSSWSPPSGGHGAGRLSGTCEVGHFARPPPAIAGGGCWV